MLKQRLFVSKEGVQYISQITNIPLIKGDECLIQSRGMGQQGTDVVLYGKARKLFPYGIECKTVIRFHFRSGLSKQRQMQLTVSIFFL